MSEMQVIQKENLPPMSPGSMNMGFNNTTEWGLNMNAKNGSNNKRRQSIMKNNESPIAMHKRRKSSITRRKSVSFSEAANEVRLFDTDSRSHTTSFAAIAEDGEADMELTGNYGKLLQDNNNPTPLVLNTTASSIVSSLDDSESDMELTGNYGKLLSQMPEVPSLKSVLEDDEDEMDMELTGNYGKLLQEVSTALVTSKATPEDEEVDMEFTGTYSTPVAYPSSINDLKARLDRIVWGEERDTTQSLPKSDSMGDRTQNMLTLIDNLLRGDHNENEFPDDQEDDNLASLGAAHNISGMSDASDHDNVLETNNISMEASGTSISERNDNNFSMAEESNISSISAISDIEEDHFTGTLDGLTGTDHFTESLDSFTGSTINSECSRDSGLLTLQPITLSTFMNDVGLGFAHDARSRESGRRDSSFQAPPRERVLNDGDPMNDNDCELFYRISCGVVDNVELDEMHETCLQLLDKIEDIKGNIGSLDRMLNEHPPLILDEFASRPEEDREVVRKKLMQLNQLYAAKAKAIWYNLREKSITASVKKLEEQKTLVEEDLRMLEEVYDMYVLLEEEQEKISNSQLQELRLALQMERRELQKDRTVYEHELSQIIPFQEEEARLFKEMEKLQLEYTQNALALEKRQKEEREAQEKLNLQRQKEERTKNIITSLGLFDKTFSASVLEHPSNNEIMELLEALYKSNDIANVLLLKNQQTPTTNFDISISICSGGRQCILTYSASCTLKRVRVLRLHAYQTSFKDWECKMEHRISSLCNDLRSMKAFDDTCQSIQQLLLQH